MFEYRNPYVIDFTNVDTYLHMHYIIGDAMDWPEYYGCNWDAFWDFMTDMVGDDPLNIEILGFEKIEEKFPSAAEKMIGILKELIHYNNDAYIKDIRIDVYRGNVRERLR